jgi:hypothetical protein
MTDRLDLDAIKARVEKATDGPWITLLSSIDDRFASVYTGRTVDGVADLVSPANAEHIAGMDPQTTLALVAEVERLRATVERALSDHWLTRDQWGGRERDVCGRCRHGDGVPLLWPCPTRAALTQDGES